MAFEHIPLLSTLIWLPILGAIPVALLNSEERANQARVLALIIALISFVLCIPLYFGFDTTRASTQFTEHVNWISALKINYDLGVDGISMPLIVLTCFTTLLVVLASWTMVKKQVGHYLSAFLVMQGAVIGVFSALDAMLFYFFWEAMLIPMYISIGIWGMEKRSYAAIKFFLYTFFGSALLLVALLYLRMHSDSFYIPDYYRLHMSMTVQILVFLGFLFAFAIKVPMWPLHTWLPDAHTEAPVGGSVVLAALMLKLGGYGFLRFSLPIVPDASRQLDWLMIALSLIAIVYIGFIAIAQTDMKKLIAYSSVAHMGFVTLGAFMVFFIVAHTGDRADAYLSLEGAMVQMISHAFGAGAMFLAFGVLYEQIHSRYIYNFGGIAKTMPYFAAFFMVFAMSNVGLPGTSGFVGEFMVLLSTFKASFWVTFLAASTLVIGAAYTLWMYKRVFYGPVTTPAVAQLKEIGVTDKIIFILVTAAIVWIGIYPNSLLNVFHASMGKLLHEALQSKL
ncbi:NADH-quinone oxidoreductase subunit M [Coxiella burnetii]|uniref:NADH-quinone oxidoreductase subunit M n=1 Tax=Coxiella burnetii (strain Dugway 5J108-111) TaxID=434922 RepID=A9KBL7_COXBN|nr:NADH-quinone oxidoreductase subunit M [Coxiella burnetii]ABS76670.1 NADH-quinone oxidoreductase chain M [Coxiella burnetii Dugway 5J108-111]OYK80724.1 NADH-quinone oxidoreductase subunit M [Coxiella burnetii]OYK82812.1 NADH-quinone oxidoreductase subunit M [Coxiella burnetii]